MDMHSRDRPVAKPILAVGKLLSPSDHTYGGERSADGYCRVWIRRKGDESGSDFGAARPRWGYGGRDPAALALALLTDALGDPTLARQHQHAFKMRHVAQWGDAWSITARAIHGFVAEQLAQDRAPPASQFPAGQIVATQGAAQSIPRDELLSTLRRHASGDWGDLEEEDWRSNDAALLDGGRLVSAYSSTGGERFWIITEADRSATTFLLPSEY